MKNPFRSQRGTNFEPKWPLNLWSNIIPTRRSLFFVNTCAKIFSPPPLFFLSSWWSLLLTPAVLCFIDLGFHCSLLFFLFRFSFCTHSCLNMFESVYSCMCMRMCCMYVHKYIYTYIYTYLGTHVWIVLYTKES